MSAHDMPAGEARKAVDTPPLRILVVSQYYWPENFQINHIVRSLHASGAILTYRSYPGEGHFDLIEAAHTDNAQWIDTQLAKMPSRQV